MGIKLVKQLQEMSLYEEGSDINVESNRLNPEDALFNKYPNLEKGGVIHQAHMPKNVILVWWFNPSTAEFVRSKDPYHLHMYDYRDKINIAEEHQWVRGRVFRNGDKVVVVIYDLKSMSEYARWDLLSKISSDIKPLMVSYIIDKDERDISPLFEGTCYKLTLSKTGYWKVVEGVLVEAEKV